MQDLVREAISQGRDAVDPVPLAAQIRLYRSAVLAGTSQTAARSGALMKKHNALARRLRDRQDDYLRFTTDFRAPPDNDRASHCTSWGRCAVFAGVRWLGWLADVILAWGGDIFAGSRAAGDAVGVAAA
jgi:hypothetical protein